MITIKRLPIPLIPPINTGDPMYNYIYYPIFFETREDVDKFLTNYDSDTRAYVINHTDEYRTKRDIIDCVHRLRYESQE